MKKQFIFSLVIIGLAFVSSSVVAEETVEQERLEMRETQKSMIRDTKERIEKARLEFNTENKEKREEREKNQEERRAELKERLAKFKDQKRAEIVSNVNDKIIALNKRLTDHFSNVVVKLENALNRISERAQRLSADGKDISTVKTAVDAALVSIKEARTAISTQANKVYDFEISENSAKLDIGKIRQSFGNDIETLKAVVKKAHTAVRDAAVALLNIENSNKEVEDNN